jgi:hypothetical protein
MPGLLGGRIRLGAMLRIIYALAIDLGHGSTMVAPLNRRGQAACRRSRDRREGMPRPPVRRTVDLRAGDEVMHFGGWRRVRRIRAVGARWLSEAEARELRGSEGYVYRPRRRRG